MRASLGGLETVLLWVEWEIRLDGSGGACTQVKGLPACGAKTPRTAEVLSGVLSPRCTVLWALIKSHLLLCVSLLLRCMEMVLGGTKFNSLEKYDRIHIINS